MLSARLSFEGEQGLIGSTSVSFLLCLDLLPGLLKTATLGGSENHKHFLIALICTFGDGYSLGEMTSILPLNFLFSRVSLDSWIWSLLVILLTSIFFLCSNLVDDKESHQVHTTRANISGGGWQSNPHVFQFLLHFSLFKELLGENSKFS